jgi:hypothetical protein
MDSKHHDLELGERIANLSGSFNVVGFLTVIVPHLIQEPPPKTEPYTPTTTHHRVITSL